MCVCGMRMVNVGTLQTGCGRISQTATGGGQTVIVIVYQSGLKAVFTAYPFNL